MGKLVHGNKVYANVNHGSGGSLPVIDLRFTTWDSLKRIESTSCMALNSTDTTLTSTYIGGVTIGCNFTIPIDVSNIDTIQGTVDIGTGYSLTQFPFYAALCEQYPNDTAPTPSSWSPVVQDTTNVANSTYNFSLDTSNLSGGYFLVFILTGMNATVRDLHIVNSAASSNYTNTDYYTQSEQITDISNFTKLYSTESSVNYGSQGTRVDSALSVTNESTLDSYMNEGWNSSHAAYYGSEDKIGAYAGYNFGVKLLLKKVKLWLGRFSGQNKSLIATIQTLDGEGNWDDIKTLDISTSLPYPLNVFEIELNRTCYGIRWIHSSGEQKTGGNNIIFFGMSIYKGTGNAERVFIPTEKVNYIPTGYSGFGTVVIDNDALINELYSFDQSQGGAWINTNVDVSDLEYILFTFSSDPTAPDDRLMRQLLKSSIAVYTGGSDVYTTIFTQAQIGVALNVRIYNNTLWVSFNGTGANTRVVAVYNPITF